MTATSEPAPQEPTALDSIDVPPPTATAQLESIGDLGKLPGVIDRKNPLGHYAGFVTRLIAFLLDQAVVLVIIFITGAAVQLLQNTLPLGKATMTLLNLAMLLAAVLIYVLYFILFWVLAGQTPGKKFMGVRIVGVDGARISSRQAIVRLIGYLISLILFLGYLWALIDARRQAWHDHLARTFVVYSWPEITKAQRIALQADRNRQIQNSFAQFGHDSDPGAHPASSQHMQ